MILSLEAVLALIDNQGECTSVQLFSRCMKHCKKITFHSNISFQKTVSQLSWIIRRVAVRFPSELLSTEETAPLKAVGSKFYGLSSEAEVQFLERNSFFFLIEYFICKHHKRNSICFHYTQLEAENPEVDISISLLGQMKPRFSPQII